MGSDLYIAVDVRGCEMWEGPSCALARGLTVKVFGSAENAESADPLKGYLSGEKMHSMQEHPECPWILDEPYWVRDISGSEFCAIVQSIPQAGLELKAFAALVAALVAGVERPERDVRVWCWESQ